MPFRNRIRLPIHAYTPQFPTEANRFRKADGSTVTQSVVIRKTYDLRTDHMGESMHQKLVIALNHDDVTIEGDKYIGGISVDGEYSIDWPDFMDYPIGPASVLIQVTPFNVTNSNCATCDVLTQLSLEDDIFPTVVEGEVQSAYVYGNDSICCFPVTAEITWFETAYLDAASIDAATGFVLLTSKDPVASVGVIKLATYRITCPDGTYDEADIYADVEGTLPSCEQPGGFDLPIFSVDGPPFEITVSWTTPASPPSGGYEWQLFEMQSPGTPVLTGTTAINEATFDAPSPSTDYGFYVRSVCEGGAFSPYTEVLFTTPAGSGGGDDCGTFVVSADDGTLGSTIYFYSFMDCNGEIQNRAINNLDTRFECMLMDAFNEPIFFQEHAGAIDITFDSLC